MRPGLSQNQEKLLRQLGNFISLGARSMFAHPAGKTELMNLHFAGFLLIIVNPCIKHIA